MKKPYSEEKTGLKQELKKFSLILFSFLFYYDSLAQIPINGFCRYESHQVDSGYTGIFSLNFNNDSFTDLILFNSSDRKIQPLRGQSNADFTMLRHSLAPVEFSRLQYVFDNNKNITAIAYTSRRSMQAGLLQFTPLGQPVISNSVRFDSYPEHVSVADINLNGVQELLISGSAFDGLSILYIDNKKLRERKIVSRESFLSAHFIDASNDGFSDIAAFNIFTNSIDLYYNNGHGHFRKVRAIPVNEKIISFRTFDLNLDSYEDIIYSDNNSLNILYNDFTASFGKTLKIRTRFTPHKFVMGDFNKDGKIDIAYINTTEGVLSLIFARDEYSFYDEIIYVHKEGLQHIVPYYSKFIHGIAVISDKGFVYTLTNLNFLSDKVNLAAGSEPGALTYFDSGNNGITDICFIDRSDNSLKFILRNYDGIPAVFYSQKLFAYHTNIAVDDSNPDIKKFFCYTPGKRLIEMVVANFTTNRIERSSLYVPGTIDDLKLKTGSDDFPSIHIAYRSGNKLGLGAFYYRDFRYTFSKMPDIVSNVEGVTITVNESPAVYFWQREGTNVSFFRAASEKNDSKPKKIATIPMDMNFSLQSFSGDLFNMEKDVTLSFFYTADAKVIAIVSDSLISLIKVKEESAVFRIKNKNQLFFGQLKFDGLKRLFVYQQGQNRIHRADFIHGGKNVIFSRVAEVSSLYSFFIKNMDIKNYHIVYTNEKENCITISRL